MDRDEIIRYLIRSIKSNHASNFFLNGPPGSGKSYFLETIKEELLTSIPHCFILGPYRVDVDGISGVCEDVLKELFSAGFVDTAPPPSLEWNFVKLWEWFLESSQIATKRTFIVLIDINSCFDQHPEKIGNLFSGVRKQEGIWSASHLTIHHIFTGNWDHPALEEYFNRIVTSFPYTTGHNYFVWTGISVDELTRLVQNRFPSKTNIPYGKALHEISGGHPGIANDILSYLGSEDLGISSLLSATEKSAREGDLSRKLISLWSGLPLEARKIVKQMILQRKVLAITFTPDMERLLITGLIRRKQVGQRCYLEFGSWYTELLVRLNSEKLGISDGNLNRVSTDESMPRLSTLCSEAYLLINEIENLARNFITVQLSINSNPNFHFLVGRSIKYNSETQIEEDAYQRTNDWRMRSANRGLPVGLNSLVAYLSTRDLANLIEELGAEAQSPQWLHIAQAIRSLSDVRDAVMHNQLIDDPQLNRLYLVQENIYEALSDQHIEVTC